MATGELGEGQNILQGRDGSFRFDQSPTAELRTQSRALVALYDKDTFFGSGFVIRKDDKYQLVTALHTLLNHEETMRVGSGEEEVEIQNPMAWFSPDQKALLKQQLGDEGSDVHDIFYLDFPPNIPAVLKARALSIPERTTEMSPGKRYYLLGYPGQGKGNVGIVTYGEAQAAVLPKKDRDIMVVKTIASGGMSGGLCVDESFTPVGVIKGKVHGGEEPGVLIETLEPEAAIDEKLTKQGINISRARQTIQEYYLSKKNVGRMDQMIDLALLALNPAATSRDVEVITGKINRIAAQERLDKLRSKSNLSLVEAVELERLSYQARGEKVPEGVEKLYVTVLMRACKEGLSREAQEQIASLKAMQDATAQGTTEVDPGIRSRRAGLVNDLVELYESELCPPSLRDEIFDQIKNYLAANNGADTYNDLLAVQETSIKKEMPFRFAPLWHWLYKVYPEMDLSAIKLEPPPKTSSRNR